MRQTFMFQGRILVWFSCGAASTVAAKLAVEKYPNDQVEILYCDTLKFEHPDNARFMADVSRWIGKEVKILKHPKYADIMEVFRGEQFIVGHHGAPCTKLLKRAVGKAYRQLGDTDIYGMTADESGRITDFERDNHGLDCDWILRDRGVTKSDCYRIIREAGITMPAMYLLGYKNNNCIGCVKGGAGYFNKIRKDFPEHFNRVAAVEREIGYAILKLSKNGVTQRVFLDELDPNAGRFDSEPDIECGPQCISPTQ